MEKIRDLGRKIYFEDLHKKSLTSLISARRQLEDAEKKGKGVEEARASVDNLNATLDHIEAIVNGKIQEENPDWEMYETIGQKEKEEADKFYEEWMTRNPMWMPKS